jgi:hypothetical protein
MTAPYRLRNAVVLSRTIWSELIITVRMLIAQNSIQIYFRRIHNFVHYI